MVDRQRQANERRGRLAEHVAAIWLIAKGYRIVWVLNTNVNEIIF
jgi:Holliday junction resolvase-like predicted endonuclease